MSSPFTERKITLIGLSLGLLVLVGLASYALNRKLEQSEQQESVRELQGIVEDVLLIQTHLSNAESGQRGFLLTKDSQYLSPYHVAVDSLPSVMTRLEQKTNHDPETKRHLETLRLLAEKKLDELRTTLEMAKDNSATAINLVRSNAGRALMDQLTHTLNVILNRQYSRLELADQQERTAADEATQTIIWSTVLALALIGTGTYRVVRDTGAREQADRLIEQTRLLNLAPIMTRDLDGRILSWSKGYEELYGWTEEEAVGKICHELLQTRFMTPPDEIRRSLEVEGHWSGELTHTRYDGTSIAVAANWTLLKEGKRKPTAIVEVNSDISDLKAAQIAQAESEARFRLLADNMSQFAWIADEKGWVHWYNKRWFDYTGTTLSEMEGWGWKKIHHHEHLDRVVEKLSGCLETGEIWEDTFPLRGRDGQYRWFLSRAIPIRSDQGRILQWFGTNTDITALHQAEQALTEQTTFTNSILNSLQATIAVIDKQGVILQVNEAWATFARENSVQSWAHTVGVGTNYLDMSSQTSSSDPIDCKAVDGIKAVLEGSRATYELAYPCHSPSERRWLQMTVAPLKTASGGAVIVHVDITAHKAAAEAQAFLAAIVTGSTDAIISKSVEGIILTWNQGAETLFGYTKQEIIGRRVDLLVPGELLDEELTLRNRVLLGTRVEDIETTRLHKAGRRLDVSISMSPILNEFGTVVASAQTIRDITLRKKTQNALRASEERFRALTTNIPQLVWSCKPDGTCDYLSEQWMAYTGTTLQQNLGYGWLTLIHPDDAPRVDQRWKESVASGSLFTTEYRLKAADGTYQWHLARATSQRNKVGEIYAWFGTTTNISAQKASETALEQFNFLLESKSTALAVANKELEAFSYSISHDLRAPLRTMTGFAQALLEDYGDKLEPEATRYLRIISNGATQMGRLIDDLLSFSRLSRQPLAMNTLSIGDLVKEVREDLAADQADRKIEWDVTELPSCRGDRTTIKLVLVNLLGNALKYSRTREIAKIQIGWQADNQRPGHCQIFVKDNGVGFDMRYADKLYAVFQRLHRADEFEGTGVGLAIVQRIVHRHGGRVWADARPNEGATFWFTLENVS